MRTNIEIDDELLQQAMRSTGAATKRQSWRPGFACW